MEHHVQPALADQTKQDEFEDSEIDGFAEKLVKLVFTSSEDFRVAGEEREEKTECSVLAEATVSDVPGEAAKTESSVLVETDSDIHETCKESEGEIEGSAFMETVSHIHGDVKKTGENETECSVFMEGDSYFAQDGRKTEEKEEETDGPIIVCTDSATTTSRYQFMSRKDISCFVEEPTTLTFSFRDFYAGPNVSAVSSDNAFASTGNFANSEFSEGLVAQVEEESVQEQRTPASNSYVDDYLLHNDDSLPSASSGLTYEVSRPKNSCEEGFGSERLEVNKEERVEHVEETQVSCDRKVSHSLAGIDTEKEGSYHGEETMWEENLDGTDSEEEEEEYEDDLDWEDDVDDELVEQLKMELKIAKQGGLATILEEEEEETESPKVVEDLKPLRIEEKVEYKDHMVEIQKVYKSYAEKMRKLDILNYQTMNAIGENQICFTSMLSTCINIFILDCVNFGVLVLF